MSLYDRIVESSEAGRERVLPCASSGLAEGWYRGGAAAVKEPLERAKKKAGKLGPQGKGITRDIDRAIAALHAMVER